MIKLSTLLLNFCCRYYHHYYYHDFVWSWRWGRIFKYYGKLQKNNQTCFSMFCQRFLYDIFKKQTIWKIIPVEDPNSGEMKQSRGMYSYNLYLICYILYVMLDMRWNPPASKNPGDWIWPSENFRRPIFEYDFIWFSCDFHMLFIWFYMVSYDLISFSYDFIRFQCASLWCYVILYNFFRLILL